MPKMSSASASHARSRSDMSCVREALVISVACTLPPVRFHSNQASMLPAHSSPFAARAWPSGIWSSSQRILLAENIGSIWRPVRSCRNGPRPRAFTALQMAAVRWHCHTTHGPTRLARRPLPDQRRLALVTDRHSRQIGPVERREALLDGRAGAAPDLQRVLLDPARLRIADRRGLAAARQDAAGGVDDQGFGIRRALVNGEDVVAHVAFSYATLRTRKARNGLPGSLILDWPRQWPSSSVMVIAHVSITSTWYSFSAGRSRMNSAGCWTAR